MQISAAYHSFPRFSAETPDQEVSYGVDVLRSIIHIGLLLTPEALYFPNLVSHDSANLEDGSDVFQKRLCFTYVRRSELVNHCAHFGAFSLEFDIVTIRKLGAVPVMYVPQPVSGDHASGFDHIGNDIIHQMRDIKTLLEEICDAEELIKRTKVKGKKTLFVEEEKGKITSLDVESLDFLIDFFRGKKGPYRNLLGYMQILANLVYHVDSARVERYFTHVDLEYYKQMEWRIISGIRTEFEEIDRKLGNKEISDLQKCFSLFGKAVTMPDGLQRSFAELSRAITTVQGRHILELARCLWVPDCSAPGVRRELEKEGLKVVVRTIPYKSVLKARAKVSSENSKILGEES